MYLGIREEVRDNCVRDCIDDVEDTRCKIGVSVVREVGRGLIVLGLGVVDFGNALSLRWLKDTCWGDLRAIENVSGIFSQFHFGF